MTPEFLNSLTAVALSLIFEFMPGVKTWYDNQFPARKQLIMLGALALATAIIVVISCTTLRPYLAESVSCDEPGFIQAIRAFGLAVIANQAVYSATRYLRIYRAI